VSDYFDSRLDLFFGRASLLLPPRQPAIGEAMARSAAASPRLAADGPPQKATPAAAPGSFPAWTATGWLGQAKSGAPPHPRGRGADRRD